MLGGGKSFSQGIPSIFSLQVSSKLSRLSITSCCHVANYGSIIWAQRGIKELTVLSSSYAPLIDFFIRKISLNPPHPSYFGDIADKEMRKLMPAKEELLAHTGHSRTRALTQAVCIYSSGS